MNTYTSYSSVVENFTFPSAPTVGTITAAVYYDFGDVVLEPTAPTLVSGNEYSLTISDDLIDSAGIYRIKWSCTIASKTFYAYTEFKVEDPYANLEDFLLDYPEFDSPEYTAKFAYAEAMSRRIVDTYCGQSFQFIKNKVLSYDGNNRNKIHLGARLNNFSTVFIDTSDFSERVSIDLRSKYFIKMANDYPTADSRIDDIRVNIFPVNTTVYVTGDWGWMSVPREIEQASKLLIADLLDDTRREHYRYGIIRTEQGNNRIQFDSGIFNSTGNIDVDTLLMDYVYWVMDYVT